MTKSPLIRSQYGADNYNYETLIYESDTKTMDNA